MKWESKEYLIEKREGLTPVPEKRRHEFLLGTSEPNEETWVAPRELPGESVAPGTQKTQKTSVGQGLYRFTATDQLL